MNDWASQEFGETECWGAMLRHATSHGAVLKSTMIELADRKEVELFYLERVFADNDVAMCPLPQGCTPQRILRRWNAENVCRTLGLPLVKGWALTL